MTRKEFDMFSESIRDIPKQEKETKMIVANFLIEVFDKNYPAYNKDKFIKRCKLEDKKSNAEPSL